MSTPNNHQPSVAPTVTCLLAFFAAAIASAWDMHAKRGGWIEVTIAASVTIFMSGSAIWSLVSALKDDRAKQLAERTRLKAFNDEHPSDRPAQ
jgi:hypothetical protein